MWIIGSVLRMISGAVFHILGICDGGAPSEKRLAPKRKCKFNEDCTRDFAWIAKLPDCGMAQCYLCATDSTADMCNIWPDCAFYDKSMTFGRQLQYTQRRFLDIGTSRICPRA